MSTTHTLPTLPTGPMAPAAVGPPVSTSALGRELPPALIEALDRISEQIAVEVFDPLLCATSEEQAAKIFERVFLKFRDYYVSTLWILWGGLQEDPQRFSALTIRSFQQSENLIRSSGPQCIGQDATLNALQALATITRVAKAAIQRLDGKVPAGFEPDAPVIETWANSIVGFAMAFSTVLAALTVFANGRQTSARLENAAALAHWSRSYAEEVYHLTKVLGLLRAPSPTAPIGSSDAEDEILAESGLDAYSGALLEDDRP